MHCRSCVTLSDCAKYVRCSNSFFSEVFFDSICSSFAQPLVVGFSTGSRGIPCNMDFNFRVCFQNLDIPFQYHLRFLALPVHAEYLMFYGVMVDLDHINSYCKWTANNRVKSEV
jgi:hypothetical protein